MAVRFSTQNTAAYKDYLNADRNQNRCTLHDQRCLYRSRQYQVIVKFRDGIVTQIKSENAFADLGICH